MLFSIGAGGPRTVTEKKKCIETTNELIFTIARGLFKRKVR